ncbi:MAG: hypothetical protein ABI868_23920 [Acidobacteriota bacterium]
MNQRGLAVRGASLVVCGVVILAWTPLAGQSRPTGSAAPSAAAKGYKAPRTPWGHPDLSGVYSNSDESGIPFEKPTEFAGRRVEDISAEELQKISSVRREATNGRATDDAARPVDRLAFWENLKAENSRAWLVTDPPDGRIPPLTPDGQRRAAAAAARPNNYNTGSDSIQDRSLYDRCITRGLPGSMMPAIYGNSYEIVQGPQHVAIIYEMIHETRVIPLDNRPHVSADLKFYMGDARGRWDGDTLVVETTNLKDQTAYRNANGAVLKIVERFKPAATGVEWSVTLEDPTTWTRAWTFAMMLSRRDASQRPFEYACHEGNYGMANILSAARAAEKESR